MFFMCVFSGNSKVKVKVKGIESFPFFNERGQQDGKDISHNSDTEAKREVSALRGNKIWLS